MPPIDINIIAQAVGFIAFTFGILGFLHRRDAYLKILLIGQCISLSIHFLLIQAYSASGLTLITAIRYLASFSRHSKIIAPIFFVLYIGIGLFHYQQWWDALPIMATLIATYGLFYCHGIKMRLALLTSTFLWIIHNAFAVSIGPFFMELIIFIANSRTIYSLWSEKNTASTISDK